MRTVVWEDRAGFKHRSVVRDTDPDSAVETGLRLDPPDLNRIDWEGVKRDLHNALVVQGIVDWESYQRHDIRPIILNALRRRVQSLYREVDNG